MHIPDGFLSTSVSAGAFAASATGLAVSTRLLKKRFADRTIPLMGVLAAFIFAAQMFNFPVAAGTSGHLMGGVLAAIVVGPMAASVVMTVVLIVQCLLFADGGLFALGANILNMAIIGTWGGWAIYRVIGSLPFVRARHSKAVIASAAKQSPANSLALFLASWSSVVMASAACALELALSGVVPAKAGLVAMAGVHAVIGIVEGFITVVVVSFVMKAKPEVFKKWAAERS